MKLSHLPNSTLHSDLSFLVTQERNLLAKILWHLKEVDRRKLYCDYKCGSLFEYAVKVLKYSESQAARRVSACRLLAEVPEITTLIESGGLNLTLLNEANSHFKNENIKGKEQKLEVLGKITGKSTREAEKIIDDLKTDKTPRKVNLRINQKTLDKLNEVKALKAHQFTDMDELLLGISDHVLSVWNPIKALRKMKTTSGQSRYVPVQVKSQVWARDKGKCQNCGSSYALELDHVKAFAFGGKTHEENLQLLCRNCNQRKGLVSFGLKSWS